MRSPIPWLVPVVAALLLQACSSPILSPKPWDGYAGETLKVYGQDPATAGQLVWRAVKEQEGSRDFLVTQGEPDSLQIRGGKFSQKTVILFYTRHGAGAPHSIQLDPGKNGFVPRAPEPIATPEERPEKKSQLQNAHRHQNSPAPSSENAGKPPAQSPGEANAAPAPTPKPAQVGPSSKQRVECPIDPTRPDCQALCTAGAPHEWCR